MPVSNTKETENLQNRITLAISSLFKDEEYAFEAYILIKYKLEKDVERKLKRFILYEGAKKDHDNEDVNFKKKLQNKIKKVIIEKYTNNAPEYDLIENIADNQNKFYIIPQTNEYNPFAALASLSDNNSSDNVEKYCVADRESAEGIFFRYERKGVVLWAFQYFWPNAIPNRKGLGLHIIHRDDVFTELKDPIMVVSHRVDFLIINDEIITDDISILQTHFGFQEYIRTTAKKIVSKIGTLNLVSNIQKLEDYISTKTTTHAKKMMRLNNSKVLTKNKEELYKKITTLPRWRDKFEINETDHSIELKNYTHVENLIDLLDERYTRSDVTDEEYDTSAKKWIGPATQ